jgi:hypothetical protein
LKKIDFGEEVSRERCKKLISEVTGVYVKRRDEWESANDFMNIMSEVLKDYTDLEKAFVISALVGKIFNVDILRGLIDSVVIPMIVMELGGEHMTNVMDKVRQMLKDIIEEELNGEE